MQDHGIAPGDLLQPGRHGVEGLAQLAQLVAAARYPGARRKVPLGQPAGRQTQASQLGQQRALGAEPGHQECQQPHPQERTELAHAQGPRLGGDHRLGHADAQVQHVPFHLHTALGHQARDAVQSRQGRQPLRAPSVARQVALGRLPPHPSGAGRTGIQDPATAVADDEFGVLGQPGARHDLAQPVQVDGSECHQTGAAWSAGPHRMGKADLRQAGQRAQLVFADGEAAVGGRLAHERQAGKAGVVRVLQRRAQDFAPLVEKAEVLELHVVAVQVGQDLMAARRPIRANRVLEVIQQHQELPGGLDLVPLVFLGQHQRVQQRPFQHHARLTLETPTVVSHEDAGDDPRQQDQHHDPRPQAGQGQCQTLVPGAGRMGRARCPGQGPAHHAIASGRYPAILRSMPFFPLRSPARRGTCRCCPGNIGTAGKVWSRKERNMD